MRDCFKVAAICGALSVFGGGATAQTGTDGNAPPIVYMTWNGDPGYLPGSKESITARKWETASFNDLKDGTVVQLLLDAPDAALRNEFKGRVEISGKRDITVRGLGAATLISGSGPETFRCDPPPLDHYGCEGDSIPVADPNPEQQVAAASDLQDRIVSGLIEASRQDQLAAAVQPTGDNLGEAACVDIIEVDGATFEDLTFSNCWLTAIRSVDSRRITLRSTTIVDGSYGLVVAKGDGGLADTVTVEDVHWIQDDTSYEDALAGRCREASKWVAGCPGQMWRSIPWGSAHHGAHIHLNGALLYARYVEGPIVFRRNIVENAYNGVRLKGRKCDTCAHPSSAWVYGNVFSYVRDNPVEFEKWIADAHVFGNRFHNAHAWLSIDEAAGGPVYVFGNRGWFDDMPEEKWSNAIETDTCYWKADFPADAPVYDSAWDRAFDYSAGKWYPTGVEEYDEEGKPVWQKPYDMACGNVIGRAIKIGMAEKTEEFGSYPYLRDGPLYVFNNSWFLRIPVTGLGMVMNMKHWNNAIQFCDPGADGADAKLCAAPPDLAIREPKCGTFDLARHPAAQGKIPFFDCFRWEPVDGGKAVIDGPKNDFNFDVSSHGFPPNLMAAFGIEKYGRPVAPGFVAPASGDFSLIAGANAATSPCAVTRTAPGELSCVTAQNAFAGAVAPDGSPYRGPPDWDVPPE